MTVVNPKSISGINSITTGSGSDDLLTIHTNNGTERLRVDSTGATKIVTGIVTTLTATTGIVTTLTTNTLTANSTTKVGSGVTLSPDGDVFTTGISTFTDNIHIKKDDKKILFGDNDELEIFHGADGSFISHTNSSQKLFINTSSSAGIEINKGVTENIAKFIPDGAVELYYNNTKRFETTNTGAKVTGDLETTSDVKVGSGITLSSDGDIFAVGVSTLGNGSSGRVILQYQGSTKLTTQNWGVQGTGTVQSIGNLEAVHTCLLYTSPSPRD